MLPKTLKNFNLFIEGQGYAGVVEELTLPKLSRKTEEYRGGGMNGEVEIDLGMEKLEMEFTLREYSREVLEHWGVCDLAGVGLRMLGAAVRDDSTCETGTIEVVVRGRWRELDFDSAKSGEMGTMKVMVAVSYYKYLINGDAVIEIDHANMIEKVNGIDRLEGQRKALSMNS
ncbi:phage major tail tube protein [Veronia pacifica]|uniref:Phage major tail tube protein n=1 Tax=Veronia pacifica TaxID=1080227 RepID=A0A1C3EE44_9GAMM|nr:phage major tail tube protein [Veronia pacifica]ODA31527.1 phage major tail tube protein [Veronia pacifica]